MVEESELNNLVSNLVSEVRYSNCRLCLKSLQGNYVRFEDSVSCNSVDKDFQPLSEVLAKLLGPEICEEIPGIDAVCMECVEKSLETMKFLEKCEISTKQLYSVLDNLITTLDIDIDTTSEHQSLYITVNADDAKLILVNNEEKKNNFSCHVCTEYFDDIIELKMHNLAEHGIQTCEKCFYTFANVEELYAHNLSDKKHKCPDCNLYRCTEESLKKHMNKVHAVYVCKHCGKSFRGIQKLQSHELKHVTKNKCPKCDKTYNTKEFYLKHVKLCLEDRIDPHPLRSKMEKKYFCDKCGKGYSTPGGLRVHNRFVHGNAKPHTCKYCQKQFTAPSYLKVHMIKHTGEKNFKCDLCKRNFVSKEALLYHTRRHTGEKPYSCTKCDEKFVNASARAEHIKFKHEEATLMCDICSRKFVTPNFLRQHMKKHHDPSNKLYVGRSLIPANVPAVENMRVRVVD